MLNKQNQIRCKILVFTHISFPVDDFEKTFEQIQKAGGEPISQPHDNTKYEDLQVIKRFMLKRHGAV